MARSGPDNALYTVIVHYTVEPRDRQRLMDALTGSRRTLEGHTGFVSVSMYANLHGTQVLLCVQLRYEEDGKALLEDANALAFGSSFLAELVERGKVSVEVPEYLVGR